MIKTYCDFCGEEIETANDQANLDWNAYGKSGFEPKDYQFHVKCAQKVDTVLQDLLKQPHERPVEIKETAGGNE